MTIKKDKKTGRGGRRPEPPEHGQGIGRLQALTVALLECVTPSDAAAAVVERGFTTAGTLGHGFWFMLRTVDAVWLLTGAGGTTVVLEQRGAPPESSWGL